MHFTNTLGTESGGAKTGGDGAPANDAVWKTAENPPDQRWQCLHAFARGTLDARR